MLTPAQKPRGLARMTCIKIPPEGQPRPSRKNSPKPSVAGRSEPVPYSRLSLRERRGSPLAIRRAWSMEPPFLSRSERRLWRQTTYSPEMPQGTRPRRSPAAIASPVSYRRESLLLVLELGHADHHLVAILLDLARDRAILGVVTDVFVVLLVRVGVEPVDLV